MKIRKLLVGLSLTVGLLTGLYFLHAQDTTFTQTGAASLSDTNVDWNSLSDFEVELKAIEAMPTISGTDVVSQGLEGNFYSAQNLNVWPPLPGDPLMLPVWRIDTNLFLIDDTNFDYAAAQAKSSLATGGMLAMDSPAGGFSPLISYPAGSLWLQINGITNGLVYLTLNGTTNGVQYQIISQTTLSNAPLSLWNAEGSLFWGSSVTNWTAVTVPQNGRSNLFLSAQSQIDSTGTGIPDWWWLKYFGQDTNVSAYADPAGDGWNNLEKFQLGMNPINFYTPPAPQGLAVNYNSAEAAATFSWQPSPGPVTGYTVEKDDSYAGTVQDFSIPADQDYFVDNVTNAPDPNQGNTINVSYKVQAIYGTNVSYWGGPVPLQQNTLSASVVAGPQGSVYLAVPSIPAGAVDLQVIRIDETALFNDEFTGDNTPYSTNFDISIGASTNGLYLIPSSWDVMQPDVYGAVDYSWYMQTLNTNGTPNASGVLTGGYTFPVEDNRGWLVPPYFDGRAQLKQNLIFLLRAALVNASFFYLGVNTNTDNLYDFAYPTNYAYAGFYQLDESVNDQFPYERVGSFDVYWPFENNYRYRNFVFNTTNLNSSGQLTTGVGGSYDGAGVLGTGRIVDGLYQTFPMTFQFQPPATNGTPISGLLATNQTQWLASYAYESPPPYLGEIGITYNTNTAVYSMAGVAPNAYGLPFLSAEIAYDTGSGVGITKLSANGNTTQGGNFYPETAQPIFQTREYDFWNPSLDALPGMTNFSTTNISRTMIASVGNPNFQVAGYAKLAMQNAYNGVYGYLGQYFTNAYQIDGNGNVTTNTTGVLSPYGQFFATQPGPAALVTMPDPDTGAQGTCTVYAISLALDANHDGIMNTNFGGPDGTSQANPYVFWANNNSDGLASSFGGDTYQDDVDTPAAPDYNYVDGLTHERAIPETRDLEDFARLWVCGVTSNLLAALPPGSTVMLNWGDVGSPNSGNPTIDIFQAADPDGGIGYLTNETVANEQVGSSEAGYLGQLGPGGSILLNASTFTNNWAGNHFIWCGASNGVGQLNLTIMDASNNVLAQASQWIQIVDIKQMYERWTVGDAPNQSPMTTPVPSADDLPTNVMQQPFRYTTNTVPNTPYILYVHGWNNDMWSKARRAEVMFKRLYWQGYRGRFGSFQWPTTSGISWVAALFSQSGVEDDYNYSEYQAWKSGTGLLNLLTNLDAEYPGHVYLFAHSLGNVVAGEALRLAGNNQVVNIYVASQAALTAHLYDSTVPDTIFSTTVTPDVFTNWLASINGNGAGKVISFYNPNDYVLGPELWEKDQTDKPSQSDKRLGPYGFWGTPYTESSPQYTPGSVDDSYPWRGFRNLKTVLDISASVTNYYEVMANASQPRATALGITAGVTNLTSLNLITIWPPDPYGQNYSDFLWHSGEFVNDNAQQQNYWRTLLHSTQQGFGL